MNRALSGWLQGLIWATAALFAAASIAELAELDAMNTARDSGRLSDALAWLDANDLTDGLLAFTIVFVWIPAFVLLIVWSFKAHRATDLLQPGGRSWSAGWTIGGWFIPMAQFVIPGLVLSEIEKIASADRVDGRVAADWRSNRPWFGGWVWWWWSVIGIFLTGIGRGIVNEYDSTVEEMRVGYGLAFAGHLALAGSLVFLVMFVRRVSGALRPESITHPGFVGSPPAHSSSTYVPRPPPPPPPQAPAPPPPPQAPAPPPTAPPDWYPDPQGEKRLRYFDGAQWTDHVAD